MASRYSLFLPIVLVLFGCGAPSADPVTGSSEDDYRCLSGDCTSTEIVAAGVGYGAIALDAGHVYFNHETVDAHGIATAALARVTRAGGPVSDIVPLFSWYADAMASDGKGLFVIARDGVRRIALDGTAAVHHYTVWPTQSDGSGDIAIDNTYLYFTDQRGGAVYKTDKAGVRPPKALATGLHWPRRLVADATNLYFSTPDGVFRIKKTGGDVIRLYDQPTRFFGQTADHLWFVSNGISSLPKAGGQARSYYLTSPGLMVAFADRVYWTEREVDSIGVRSTLRSYDAAWSLGSQHYEQSDAEQITQIAADAKGTYFVAGSALRRSPL